MYQLIYESKASKKLGYEKHELLGLYVWDWNSLFPKEIWPSFLQKFLQKKHIHFQSQHLKKTGEVFPVDIKAHLFQEKSLNYLLAFVNDISEMSNIEKELLENKKILEHIINLETDYLKKSVEELKLHKSLLDIHSAVSVCDADGKITYINELFSKLCGYSTEEVIGKNHNILKSGIHENDFFKKMYQNITSGKIWKGEICNKTKDGNLYWIYVTIIPQMNSKNNVLQFFSIMTDITDKKLNEIKVRENSEKLKAILNNASDGIQIIDRDGNVIECSQSFADMIGYSQDETLGLKIWDFDLNTSPEKFAQAFGNFTDKSSTIQSRYKTKHGKYLDVEITNRKIILQNDELLYCASRNITERLEEQKKIEELANTDYLTGLANRNKFMSSFGKYITEAKINNTQIALAYIDIDKFKTINDKYGHNSGDDVLILMGRILSHNCRKNDIVARIGGDEFTVLLEKSDLNRAENFRDKLFNSYNRKFAINKNQIEIKYSVGLAIYPNDGETIEKLMQVADNNLYIAKEKRR